MRDVAMKFQGKVCSESDEEKCSKKHGEFLEWECGICLKKGDKLKAEDIGHYTHYVLDLRRLQLGGFPFTSGDLEYETWQDLGDVNDLITQIRGQQLAMIGLKRIF